MTQQPELHGPARGRRPGPVSTSGVLTIVGSLVALVGCLVLVGTLASPQTRRDMTEMLEEMGYRNSPDLIETVLSMMNVLSYVAAAMAVVSLALGILVLRGSRPARLGITILGPIGALMSLGIWPLALVLIPMIVVALVMVWKQESRAWFGDSAVGRSQVAYPSGPRQPGVFGAPHGDAARRQPRFPVTSGPPTDQQGGQPPGSPPRDQHGGQQQATPPTYAPPASGHSGGQPVGHPTPGTMPEELPEGWRPPPTWVPPDDWAPHPSWNPPAGWVPPPSWVPPPGWTPPEPRRQTRRPWDNEG